MSLTISITLFFSNQFNIHLIFPNTVIYDITYHIFCHFVDNNIIYYYVAKILGEADRYSSVRYWANENNYNQY